MGTGGLAAINVCAAFDLTVPFLPNVHITGFLNGVAALYAGALTIAGNVENLFNKGEKAAGFRESRDLLLNHYREYCFEANFRSILVEAFSIRYSDTHHIPLDVEAVNAYKSQKVPYIECPGSVFSYATMVAFSNLMRTVVVRWSEETTLRWNGLVDRVSEAIRSENERKLSLVNRQHTLERERERLDQENRLLKEQIDELKKTFDRSEALAKSTTGRLRERALLLAVPIFLALGIMALFISFRTLDKGSVAQLAQYQQQKELEQIRQQVLDQQQKALDQRQQVEMLLRQIEQRLAPQAPAPQGLQPQQRQPEQPQQQTPADETPRKQ